LAKYSLFSRENAGVSAVFTAGFIGKGIEGAQIDVDSGLIVGVNQGTHTSSNEW